MAQTTFQIPGLGQAKPNEELPVENFAPDLLAAAASISGENGLVVGGTNGNAQWEKAQKMKKERQDEDARSTTATAEQAGDGVELDAKPASAVAEHADEKKDVQMQDQELRNGGDEGRAADVDMTASNDAPSPDVTHALEAALDGMLSHAVQPAQRVQGQEQQNDAGSEEQEDGQPEWEADSSPYESSSESSSSDSSSDDDSEDEGGYPLLGIEETARLLMAADGEGEGDGDGDGAGRSKGASAALRTKNEIVDEVIPIPDVTITPEMKIERLGNIEFIVENTVVIKSQTPGEVQVLDLGSVLCKEDRTVIGALAEVLGNVRSPMYTVGFRAEDEIKQLGLVVGLPIYYSVEHANYVFTQPLREAKGTDASNLHDEEAAADEMEFSDDEKEAEFKRQQKMKKRGGKAGRGGREQSIATSHTLSPHPPPAGLNYDEDDDGPYKPLSRPPGYGQGESSSLPSLPPKPAAGFSPPRGGHGHGHRGAHRGGRGDFRGRNQRGGHRGGDRRHGPRGSSGSYPQFGHDGASSPQMPFSHPPPPPPQNPHLPPPPFAATPGAPAGQWSAPAAAAFVPPPVAYPHSPPAGPPVPPPHHQPPSGNFTFNYQAWNQNQGQQYQYPPAAPHQQPPQPQPPAHPTGYAQPFVPPQAPAWPVAGAVPQAPQAPPTTGALNPAFYGSYQQPQPGQQQGQPYWPQQQHGGYGQGPTR
ncbi:uncharacterized protein THITE_2114523 [Thermothielavioides terrestris NRRL 8126]|uniref:H/ACA ribonucleoprotein complex non-core subunit NAF1 n=1 Tax=Thermothielavioides terrestris (strain ATCC 38088 / NRRL 8126) TaxID=578455 RepID=G2R051_THETT|nr:uncharacterized protein THITE_2114523 [Thermothielavioides terrestris NRRL 8126]AEO66426.1 hypothetical protein THITE_2114523 [Thermothielavioides terrestris NRRL 8126]